MIKTALGTGLVLLLVGIVSVSAETELDESQTKCLINALNSSAGDDTVAMVREKCSLPQAPQDLETQPENLLETRKQLEDKASQNRFSILQHKSNYLLPLAYNSKVNQQLFEQAGEEGEIDNAEFKFQFSLKLQLTDSLFTQGGRLFAAYTNQSYWQVYNTENSGPFRETNHEPEIFMDFDSDYQLADWKMPLYRIGLVHQSNGRAGVLSRSWDRLYAQLYFEKRNWAISFRPWIRFSEDRDDDDNPDIDDFMGNFELGILRKGNTTTSSLLLRNNLESDNKGAIQFNLSRPVHGNSGLRWYFQYFYGYGESLIDYNALTNRASIGLQLSDLL